MTSTTVAILLLCCRLALSLTFVSHKSCNNAARGTIVANPANCSQYIKCNGLRSTLGECPEGRYFNERMLSCENNAQTCKTKDVLNLTTSVVVNSTANVVDLNTNIVNASANVVSSTVYDDNITTALPLILLTAQTTAAALPTPAAVAAASAGAVSTTLGRPVCHAWFEQQFPHPNCEYYYHCVRGFLTVRRCTFGYGWDLERQHCVTRTQAHCFKLQDL